MGLEEEKTWQKKRYEKNLIAIQKAQPGSDIYGVLEKTAFHLQRLRQNSDDIKNWFDAQTAFSLYTSMSEVYVGCNMDQCLDLSTSEDSFSSRCCMASRLKQKANDNAKIYDNFAQFFPKMGPTLSQFDFWIMAQDKLARTIVRNCKFFLSDYPNLVN